MTQNDKENEVVRIMSALNSKNQDYAITLLRVIRKTQDITISNISKDEKGKIRQLA